ncbi:MAG: phospholipid carrier-dependent glycosyltransferase [Candidatus Binataceae bacterium]
MPASPALLPDHLVARRKFYRLSTVALLAALLYLPALGSPPLWEPDEGRYAEIAREMALSGDYVTPRDDWVRYFEKPPLTYWLMAAAIKVMGPTELAVRLPAASFSIGQVVVTAALGDAMFDPPAGLLAAAVLALSPIFFGFARFATLDPALAFFITAAMAAFFIASRAPDLGYGRGRRWMLLSAGMLALGTLAKGPVALALGGAIAFFHLLGQGRIREIRRIPWLSCAALYGLIAAPWFVLVARRNPGFVSFFFVHEHLHRYLSATEHVWGPYFPAAVALAGTWPWIYFAPLAFQGSRGDGPGGGASAGRAALGFLVTWCVVVIALFSIPRAKLGSYVLPAVPALAILAGRGLRQLGGLNIDYARKLVRRFALVNLALGVGCGVAVEVFSAKLPPALVTDGLWLAAGLALCGLMSLSKVRRPTSLGVMLAVAAGVALIFAAGMKARSDMSALYTSRELAREIEAYVPPGGCLIASDHRFLQALPFYTGIREALVGYKGELEPFSHGPDAAGSFIGDRMAFTQLWSTSPCTMLIADGAWIAQIYLETLKPTPIVIAHEGASVVLYHGPRMPSTSASTPPSTEDGSRPSR